MDSVVPLSELVEQYLVYQAERGRSERTVRIYRSCLQRFLACADIRSPRDINAQSISRFVRRLDAPREQVGEGEREQRVLSSATKNLHLIAVRGLLRHLRDANPALLDPRDVRLCNVPNGARRRVCNPDELAALITAADGQDTCALRDRAIILLCASGMRVSDVCALDVEGVETSRMTKHTKRTGRARSISDEACEAVARWMAARPPGGNALFVSLGPRIARDGNRLTPRTVQRIVKSRGRVGGVGGGVTPETLRHATA